VKHVSAPVATDLLFRLLCCSPRVQVLRSRALVYWSAECVFPSSGADRELPADCEAKHVKDIRKGAVYFQSTEGSLQRCVLANNADSGLTAIGGASARVQGCKFVGNAFSIFVQRASVVYTDTPTLVQSRGCNFCTDTGGYGPVLPLSEVPTGVRFLTGTDTAFVALQLVRPRLLVTSALIPVCKQYLFLLLRCLWI
jgi:hypothetical protein